MLPVYLKGAKQRYLKHFIKYRFSLFRYVTDSLRDGKYIYISVFTEQNRTEQNLYNLKPQLWYTRKTINSKHATVQI